MTSIYKFWFDPRVDVETPYKAIGLTKSKTGEEVMRAFRFESKAEAIDFFNQCKGRCIVSHHDYNRKITKILAYKFK